MWDILYWTWINLLIVLVVGNRGWWLYLVVPGYAAYSAMGVVGGVRSMMGGVSGGAEGDVSGGGGGAQSKRQKKMENRGGQKVVYR